MLAIITITILIRIHILLGPKMAIETILSSQLILQMKNLRFITNIDIPSQAVDLGLDPALQILSHSLSFLCYDVQILATYKEPELPIGPCLSDRGMHNTEMPSREFLPRPILFLHHSMRQSCTRCSGRRPRDLWQGHQTALHRPRAISS